MSIQMKKRITAFLLCVLFVIVSSLSIAFLVEKTEHCCSGQSCTICIQLRDSEQLLRQLAVSITGTAGILGCLLLAGAFLQSISNRTVWLTPISLKDRMNH